MAVFAVYGNDDYQLDRLSARKRGACPSCPYTQGDATFRLFIPFAFIVFQRGVKASLTLQSIVNQVDGRAGYLRLAEAKS